MSVEQIDLTSYHVTIAPEKESDRRLEEHADRVGRMGADTRVRLANIAANRTGDLEKIASEAVVKIAEAEEEQRIARGRLGTTPGLLEAARTQLAFATERLEAAEAEGWRIEGEILAGAVTVAVTVDVVAAPTATPETPDEAPMETTATTASWRQMVDEALWGAAEAPLQQEARPRVDLWSDPPAIEVLDAPLPEALQRDDAWTDEDDLLATLPPRSSRSMAKAGRTSYRELFIFAGIVLGSLMASALILLATRG